MDPKLLKVLSTALDDVIEVLNDAGWEDEASWYDDLRAAILAAKPDSPEFVELLVELERSFMGIGSFTDIPLAPKLVEITEIAAVRDADHQRYGLVSCATGIIQEIKKSI